MAAQRHSSLFVEHNLPFVDIRDVLQPLRKKQFDTRLLEKANHLCNLATFIYIILDPDRATELLKTSGRHGHDTMSTFGRGGIGGVSDLTGDFEAKRRHVQTRNRLLLMAWKVFWTVVIPTSQRGSKRAMEIWLSFSTQVNLSAARLVQSLYVSS